MAYGRGGYRRDYGRRDYEPRESGPRPPRMERIALHLQQALMPVPGAVAQGDSFYFGQDPETSLGVMARVEDVLDEKGKPVEPAAKEIHVYECGRVTGQPLGEEPLVLRPAISGGLGVAHFVGGGWTFSLTASGAELARVMEGQS